MRSFALLLGLFFAGAAIAEDALSKADPKQGKALHDTACIACHARYYGGDGSGMYTREQRIVGNRRELLLRVATCNAMVQAGWFPEEEAAVAAWLNQRYYHFEP